MSCGVVRRCVSDPALLWCRPAAVALIRPLAWESPYALGVALKKQNTYIRKYKIFFGLFAISRAAPTAYGGSQARGLIRAVAVGLHLSSQLCRILNPLS